MRHRLVNHLTLFVAGWVPGEVIVNHSREKILQIDTFREAVCRDKYALLFFAEIIDTLFPLAGDEFARDAANRDIILFLQFFLQRVVDVLSRCDKAAEDDGIKTLRQQFLHVLSEEPDLRIVLASSERPRFRKKRIQFR